MVELAAPARQEELGGSPKGVESRWYLKSLAVR